MALRNQSIFNWAAGAIIAAGLASPSVAQTFQGQNVNLSQIKGVAVDSGNGATSASTQRVTISNDSTGLVTTPAIGSNSAAAPTHSILLGVSDSVNLQPLLAPIILGDGVNGNNTASTGNFLYNGTSWDRGRTIAGAVAAGTGTAAVANAPTSAATGALTSVSPSTALESSHVMCNAACNAYGFQVNTTSAAEWVLAYNLTAAPADGAVTPARWWQVPANGTLVIDMTEGNIPIRYTTGWTLVCSTTGPFTQTLSALCTFAGEKQ